MIEGGHQVQVVRPVDDDVEQIAAKWGDQPGPRPEPIRRLTAEVSLGPLHAAVPDSSIVLGVGGAELAPLVLDLTDGASVLAVVGPHGSGRSTALMTILESVLRSEPATSVTVLCARPGLLGLAAEHPRVRRIAVTADDVGAAVDELLSRDDLHGEVLLVDDAGMVAPMIGERLDQVLRGAVTSGLRCVISARAGELNSSFEPWARYVVGLRRILLLQPSREDAYAAGASLPGSVSRWPPGRGLLVSGSGSELVQVAVPEQLEGS
jgi:S-DNA-T family DNA segregation ATPase FtsK/SpoIIIE